VEGINPLVVSLFNIMVCGHDLQLLLFIDGTQKIPAWPFASVSLSGRFALLPYLALREPNTEFSGKRMRFSNC